MATTTENKTANSRVIKAAFARLKAGEQSTVEAGMKSLLQEAMEYAIRTHDEKHPNHVQGKGDYGWVLMHDGRQIAIRTNAPDNSGPARAQLEKVAQSQGGGSGWHGFLLAYMLGYYSVDYEMNILYDTSAEIAVRFRQFFKKVQVQ